MKTTPPPYHDCVEAKLTTKVRKALGMTQVQLGSLLGVHPITVSKWECGRARPTLYQLMWLQTFELASKRSKRRWGPPIQDKYTPELLLRHGIPHALYNLLSYAGSGFPKGITFRELE